MISCFDLGDVGDDLLGAAVLDVVLDRVELVGDLVEDREAVVEQVVQHLVEEPAGSFAEKLLAEALVLLHAVEEARDREQLDVRDRDEVVRAEEEVELAGVQALDVLVVRGKVEDAEEVAVIEVVVDLRPLALRQDVFHVERMPAETLAQSVDRLGIDGWVEMDPGEAVGAELSDAWFRARCGRLASTREASSAGCGAGWASVLSGSSVVGAMFAMVPGTPARESTWGVKWRCAGIRRSSARA